MQIMTDRGRVVPGQWVMVITNDGRLEKDNGMTVNTPLYVRLKPARSQSANPEDAVIFMLVFNAILPVPLCVM